MKTLIPKYIVASIVFFFAMSYIQQASAQRAPGGPPLPRPGPPGGPISPR